MITIDKKDSLYKYLLALDAENVEELYVELANNGRFHLDDVRAYFYEIFRPSNTEDVKEEELERILDYYVDLKTIKHLNSKALKDKLVEYKQTKNAKIREEIINSQLKDVLYLCLNYVTLHKDADVQDLVQIANIGLMEAIEKYNETAKIEFKDYLIYYTRKNIKEFEEKTNGKC